MTLPAAPTSIPTLIINYHGPLTHRRIETAIREALDFVRGALGVAKPRSTIFPGLVCFMAQLSGPAGAVEVKFKGDRKVFEISILQESDETVPPAWAAAFDWELSFGRFRLQDPGPELQRIVPALHRLNGELAADRLEIQFVLTTNITFAPGIVLERVEARNAGWFRALVVTAKPG